MVDMVKVSGFCLVMEESSLNPGDFRCGFHLIFLFQIYILLRVSKRMLENWNECCDMWKRLSHLASMLLWKECLYLSLIIAFVLF